jgi:hypothetical protein
MDAAKSEQRREPQATAGVGGVGCKHELSKPSQQPTELPIGQARIQNDVTHCDGVDWIMPRDRDDSVPIGSHPSSQYACPGARREIPPSPRHARRRGDSRRAAWARLCFNLDLTDDFVAT